jgi:hypothetical protein
MDPGRALLILTLFIALPCASSAAGSSNDQRESVRDRETPEQKAKPNGGSMTGCVDEQEGGRYILVDERTLTPVANLEAEGFDNESFAKHLGQKVTVRGTINSTGARPVVKVRSIETISSGCGENQRK